MYVMVISSGLAGSLKLQTKKRDFLFVLSITRLPWSGPSYRLSVPYPKCLGPQLFQISGILNWGIHIGQLWNILFGSKHGHLWNIQEGLDDPGGLWLSFDSKSLLNTPLTALSGSWV
jgi:hypothetical protein